MLEPRDYLTIMRARGVRKYLMRMSLSYSAIQIFEIHRISNPKFLFYVLSLIHFYVLSSTEANLKFHRGKESKYESVQCMFCDLSLYCDKSFCMHVASQLNSAALMLLNHTLFRVILNSQRIIYYYYLKFCHT